MRANLFTKAFGAIGFLSISGYLAAADVDLLETYQSSKDSPSIKQISDMRLMADGRVFTADDRLGVVAEFSSEGVVATNLSSKGVIKGKSLTGISVVDGSDYAVSSSTDGKVITFASDFSKKAEFGSKGSDVGMLKSPTDLSYSDINKRFYVADNAGYISVFSHTGVFLYSIGNEDPNELRRLKSPLSVKVDQHERVYVLDEDHGVFVFNQSGAILKHYASSTFAKLLNKEKIQLTSLAVDRNGSIFLSDKRSGRILHYDWRSDKQLGAFGSKGKNPGQYLNVTAMSSIGNKLAIGDSGNKKVDVYSVPTIAEAHVEKGVYASVDYGEQKDLNCSNAYTFDNQILCLDIKKDTATILDQNGAQKASLSGIGKNPIQAVIANDTIAVLGTNIVSLHTTKGKNTNKFGSSGRQEGQLRAPQDVFIHDKRIYVADTGNKRVQIFSNKGVFLSQIPAKYDDENPELVKPVSVAVDSAGQVFIADNDKKKVRVYSPENQFVFEIGEPTGTPSAFTKFYDLNFDEDDNLYVLASTEQNDQTVHVYKNKERLFRFGHASKKERWGLQQAKSLSLGKGVKTTISLYDAKKSTLLQYKYIKVPDTIGNVVAKGTPESVALSWDKSVGSYVAKYNVYGTNEAIKGTLTLLGETQGTQFSLEKAEFPFYKVSAVSGFDKEGLLSAAAEDRFFHAYQSFNEEKHDETQTILAELIAEDDKYGAAILYLGKSYEATGNIDSALAQYDALIAIPGFEEKGKDLSVDLLIEKQNYLDALNRVKSLIESGNADSKRYMQCGELSILLNDTIGAVGCLEEVVKTEKDNMDANFMLGEAYIKLGAKNEGIAQIESVVEHHADNAEAWARLAKAMQGLGDDEKALTNYQKALEIDAKNKHAMLGAAQIYLNQKKWEEAKNIALSLTQESDSVSEGQYILGAISLEEGQVGSALLSLNKSVRANPKNVLAWSKLSDVYVEEGSNEKAIKSLEEGVHNSPNDVELRSKLATMLLDEGDYQAAKDTIYPAVKANPTNADIALMLAKAYDGVGDLSNGLSEVNRILKIKHHASADAYSVKADILDKQGKTGDAIDVINQAINKDSQNDGLRVRLGHLYLTNNLYDQALAAFEQALVVNPSSAIAELGLGDMYMKRRLFDIAIEHYQKAEKHQPGNVDIKNSLNLAFQEKKKSESFSYNQPQLVLEDLKLNPVFSAAYKQYNTEPVGEVTLRNAAATDYGNLSVSFEIKGYMDFPTSVPVTKVAGGERTTIPLKAAFNNKVLTIDEDTGVQVEVKLNYVRDGQKDSISLTQPMTIYGKNAIVWGTPNMIGSFVTPKDDTLRDFVRSNVNKYKPEHGPLSEALVSAMTLFNVYKAHGIKYVVDPSNPFAELGDQTVDYVQFSRETLHLRSGDCDDLSVLLSAGLENLGIETALLDVPGHLLMMFNTGLPVEKSEVISQQSSLMAEKDGFIWIPLEATMISTSFAEAWAEGAKKFHENKAANTLGIIPLKTAWSEFQPVTLTPYDKEIASPPEAGVKPNVAKDIQRLLVQGVDRIIAVYKTLVESNPDDLISRNQIAITYAKYGINDKALKELDVILSKDAQNAVAYNTKGNIHLGKGDYKAAIEQYQKAESVTPSDAGVKMNISIAHYQAGQVTLAQNKYQEAVQLSEDVAKRYETFGSLLHN